MFDEDLNEDVYNDERVPHIKLDKDAAEQIETFLRMLTFAARYQVETLVAQARTGELAETAETFAEKLEFELDKMRDNG